MKTLINISEKKGQKVVSARELYHFLKVDTPFRKWIERMFKYGFEENLDYTLADKNVRQVSGTKKLKEYALTLDCAKEISMLQRNEKGKQARKYFIEVEKQAKQNKAIDFDNPEAVLELAQNWAKSKAENQKLQNEVQSLKPQAQLMQKVMDTEELIDIGQCAKILECGFGRNKLFQILRDQGIFFKNRNEPKQYYIDKKYFVLKETLIQTKVKSFTVIKVLVTQKGLAFLSRFLEHRKSQTKMALIH